MEFKGTKGTIEIVEHSWSDTSLMIDNKQIAFKSIEDEADEENQEELEKETAYNMLLLSKAPEMLEMLQKFLDMHKEYDMRPEDELCNYAYEVEQLIKQATEL